MPTSEVQPDREIAGRTESPILPAPVFDRLIAEMRRFQDLLAGAALPVAEAEQLTTLLATGASSLAAHQVPDVRRDFSNRRDVPSRGQSMTPWFEVVERDHDSVVAQVRFGRFFNGVGGVAHGGTIPLIFDDVLGSLASWERSRSRTAYLNVSYLSVTPLDTTLILEAAFEREEGRKRFLRGTLRNGDTECARAESLFVATTI
ncbi:PaaI family thioesterase [Rhodococcus sp. USK10]|uniref:PaaI family thioesterase n=1 Tax=Rhodococcus sp. USK10 TaxID=2789739 RepID=UPI001C5EB6C8|nr:PaaI family thioesterase [Rhodococcus sp. USK10]QYB07020.1 PaaI family thioesterase [Rhodococcus sp. USK10]